MQLQGSSPCRPIMLRTIRIQQQTVGHISFLRCYYCHKRLLIGSLAVKENVFEKETYCNQDCLNKEIDEDMRHEEGYHTSNRKF